MQINKDYLNENKYRDFHRILIDKKYLIIHHTAGVNSLNTLRGLTKSQVSVHYLIDKKGIIYYLISENIICRHTGDSNKGPKEETIYGRNLNPISIGIELENLGDGKDPYTKEQINSLIELTIDIIKRHNIKTENILGHKELTTRKIDPSHNFFEGDMEGFRNFINNKLKMEEKKENHYLKFDSFELFNDLNDNGEIKKLIEIGIYNFVKQLKNKTLKIRKGIK